MQVCELGVSDVSWEACVECLQNLAVRCWFYGSKGCIREWL